MLLMNQTLAETIAHNVQIVPSAGHYQNLYELKKSNYELSKTKFDNCDVYF